MKVDVPRFADDSVKAKYLTELQAEIIRVCTEPGLLLGFMRDLWSISEPKRSLSLPWSAMTDVSLLPPEAEVCSAIRFPHSYTLNPLEGENGFEVIQEGTKVRLNEVSARVLDCVLDASSLSIARLHAKCELTESQLHESLAELMRLGIILVTQRTPVSPESQTSFEIVKERENTPPNAE